MGRKDKSVTLSLDPQRKEILEELAAKFGYYWGENPNISQLLKAIADGEIQLSKKEVIPKLQRNLEIKREIIEIQEALLRIEQNL